MPQPEDKCYALFSKFYLGQASTEKPGTKPDIDPELLAKIEANFERGKAHLELWRITGAITGGSL